MDTAMATMPTMATGLRMIEDPRVAEFLNSRETLERLVAIAINQHQPALRELLQSLSNFFGQEGARVVVEKIGIDIARVLGPDIDWLKQVLRPRVQLACFDETESGQPH
jgi:hypothetical protein